MTDDRVLEFNGGDAPDDRELASRLVALYAETPPPAADAASRCARAVLRQAGHSPGASPGRTRWWWSAAAAAAALVVIVARQGLLNRPASSVNQQPVGSTTTVDQGAAVQFSVLLPKDAIQVSVVGDFNGWDTAATPMARTEGKGAWSAKVTLLPGRHVYAYVVDGKRWLVDPLAPQVPDVGYGPANAVVVEASTK